MRDGQLQDCQVVCEDGRAIGCSARLLEARWDWFKEQRRAAPGVDDDYTLYISEPYPIVKAFLEYIYTLDLVTVLQHRVPVLTGLLMLAKQYGVPHLERLAVHALHGRLDESTALGIYEVATLCECRHLQVRALKMVLVSAVVDVCCVADTFSRPFKNAPVKVRIIGGSSLVPWSRHRAQLDPLRICRRPREIRRGRFTLRTTRWRIDRGRDRRITRGRRRISGVSNPARRRHSLRRRLRFPRLADDGGRRRPRVAARMAMCRIHRLFRRRSCLASRRTQWTRVQDPSMFPRMNAQYTNRRPIAHGVDPRASPRFTTLTRTETSSMTKVDSSLALGRLRSTECRRTWSPTDDALCTLRERLRPWARFCISRTTVDRPWGQSIRKQSRGLNVRGYRPRRRDSWASLMENDRGIRRIPRRRRAL